MLKKISLSFLVMSAGCDYCVENAGRVLGKDAFCKHAGSNTVVCYSQSRQKGYVCMTDGGVQGTVVCVEGLAPQLEAVK